jgi:hypothetical protein
MFVNLTPEKATRYTTQLTMQSSFDVIYENCKQMGGCFSKVFLFDKVALRKSFNAFHVVYM